jgi:hypothetical protein
MTVFPVFIKGNRLGCNNYRGNSLLSVARKVYANITTHSLNTINEYVLSEEDCRYRKERSCSECVFITEQLIKKWREFSLPTYILSHVCMTTNGV